MRYIKTYGIDGLLEWHGSIDSNGVKMKVHFTNGSLTAVGVAPATFTTKNELTQRIIENSDQFKSGRIRLTMCAELPGEKEKPAAAAGKQATDQAQAANAVSQDSGVKGEKKQVKVSSVEDAKDYLVENYGLKSSNLRTRAACIAAGEENGVEFVWDN